MEEEKNSESTISLSKLITVICLLFVLMLAVILIYNMTVSSAEDRPEGRYRGSATDGTRPTGVRERSFLEMDKDEIMNVLINVLKIFETGDNVRKRIDKVLQDYINKKETGEAFKKVLQNLQNLVKNAKVSTLDEIRDTIDFIIDFMK